VIIALIAGLVVDAVCLSIALHRLTGELLRVRKERDLARSQRDEANDAIQRMALDRIRESVSRSTWAAPGSSARN
jgi:hypothetical protein